MHKPLAPHSLSKLGATTQISPTISAITTTGPRLVDCNCLDERMLFNSQLTQVRSLVQATSHETIEQTVAAAAQAASLVLNLLKLLSVPKRNALREGKP